MRELSRPSDARVERLAALPTRFLPIPPVRVEEIATTIGEERNPFIRSGRGSTQQALGFEVLQALASRCAALECPLDVALGHDSEGADRCQHAAVGSIDLVGSVPVSHQFPLRAERQINLAHEDVSWVQGAVVISVAATGTAPTRPVPRTTAVAVF